MKLKEAVEILKKRDYQAILSDQELKALQTLIDNAVLERLDEEKVQDELYKTGLYSCWFNTKTDAQSICQKFGTPKIDDLIKSVLTWWKEHQYDTESVSSGEIPEEYNVYDETPDFVKIAQAEDDFHKEG